MTDGNSYAIDRYLASLDEEVGTEEGELCKRFPEPDEDMPRGYRPQRCGGVMTAEDDEVICDTCGELA